MWLSNWLFKRNKKDVVRDVVVGERWYRKTNDPLIKRGIYIRNMKYGCYQYSYILDDGYITDTLYSNKIDTIKEFFEKENK